MTDHFPPETLGGLLHSLLRVDLFFLVVIFALTKYLRRAINENTRINPSGACQHARPLSSRQTQARTALVRAHTCASDSCSPNPEFDDVREAVVTGSSNIPREC